MIIHVSIQVNFEIVQCHPVNLREWSLTMGKDGGGGGGGAMKREMAEQVSG